MTQTEANLAVLKAAELFLASAPGCCVTVPGFGAQKLATAIKKVQPRVEKMAARLKASRAKRNAPKAWVPAYIERATELPLES